MVYYIIENIIIGSIIGLLLVFIILIIYLTSCKILFD
jgi:hypothetical protein